MTTCHENEKCVHKQWSQFSQETLIDKKIPLQSIHMEPMSGVEPLTY